MDDDLRTLLDTKHTVPAEAVRSLSSTALDELEELAAADMPQALELLSEVRPERAAALARVLAGNEAGEPAMRALAARVLARTLGPDAEPELIALAASGDPTIAATALRELGGVGSPRCLDVVAAWKESEGLSSLATLTSALVAFRSDVAGYEPELPARRGDDVVRWDEDIRLERLPSDESRRIAAQIRTYGASLSDDEAHLLMCRERRFAVLLSADVVVDRRVVLPATGRLAAVIATQAEVDGSWSTALLALAWRSKGGHAVGVFRTDGRPVYGGEADEAGAFELVGLVGGGQLSAHIRGEAGDGLRFDEARSGVTEEQPLLPTPVPPPG